MKLRLTVLVVTILAAGSLRAQQAPIDSGLVIQTETKLVVVDAVVTDKKNQYVRDLKAKDFKVWEDGKEQAIKSFAFEADPTSPVFGQNHYMVLFFDNASMDPGDQIRARQAAVKFIDSNAGPDRLMAVVNFGGALHVAQNFTANVERLKNAANGVKIADVSPNDNTGPLARVANGFAAQSMLSSLRELARSLGSVPGRKTLVLLTAGFPLRQEFMSDLTVAIDACNRSNVAIYPIDIRGVTTGGLGLPRAALNPPPSVFQTIAFSPTARLPIAAQAKGGGGTSGGTSGGGATGGGGAAGGGRGGGASPAPSAPAPSPGAGGGRGPATTGPGQVNPGRGGAPTNGVNGTNGGRGQQSGPNAPFGNGRGGATMPPVAGVPNRYGAARDLIPKMPENVATNQQLLYALADGTGGFVIQGDNDLLAGMKKIASEQNEYYVLGYTPPPDAKDGACHTLRVKVERGGTSVRFRTGYCSTRPKEVLAGNPIEKTLETKAAAAQAGTVPASISVPFFYTSPNVARVNVAMEIKPDALKFEKAKNGRLHAEINVLGVAYKKDNSVAARFSDVVKLDFDEKSEVDAFKLKPYHYENQFEIASGEYTFKVAFSEGGDNFGKLEAPLAIEPYQTSQFALSALALSREARKTADLGSSLEASLIEDRTPLIADGFQITPLGSPSFKTTDKPLFYFEIYDPSLAAADPKSPPNIKLEIRVLDRKTKIQKMTSGLLQLDVPKATANLMLPQALRLPVTGFPAGSYLLVVDALDESGKQFERTADFEIE
ncbi:MAG TPA: VWA domain-containing protein [Bryobacteraceae bacterium]|jgi:VWFA-related protein